MEETLGKRIAANRKKRGLTQDALAEQLGVTAQAVSKWENDQSCPDITMLPKLAQIFDMTTDELLGIPRKEVHTAEIVREQDETDGEESHGIHMDLGTLDFKWELERKSSVAFALWILLVGGILLAMHFSWPSPYWSFNLFDLLWTTGLLVFGLSGLFPHFSMFRVGCAFFGGYFLLERGGFLNGTKWGMGLFLPILLLLFGISLLLDALRKPKNRKFTLNHNGKSISSRNYHTYGPDSFSCATCFGENEYLIRLLQMASGTAEVNFGAMTVDLSGCETILENCSIDLNCSFGELTILVPKQYRTEIISSTAFGNVQEKGTADSSASASILLNCDANFGQICIRHI